MILSALNDYYQRLLTQEDSGISPFGYSQEKISYEILLSPDGTVVDVNDIRDVSGKKPFPRTMSVPQPEKRTVGIKANFLWDKTSYVLGVSATSKRADKEHEAFLALHRACLTGESDAGLQVLLAFLESWTPEMFNKPPFRPDMLDSNVVFRLDSELGHLHERPAARAVRARLLGGEEGDQTGMCLVSGEALPLARLHPAIKGVNGAQSSGASIVSFNLESFGSYGKSQGDNAPVSEQAAFAYTTVLNHLLRRSEHNRQRLQVGDATVVFWAKADDTRQAEAAEDLMASFLNPPPDDEQETQKLRSALEAVSQGRPLRELDPDLSEGTRIFVLGLAPNASRLSIRFWQSDSLGVFAERLAQHYHDMELQPLPWSRPPAIRYLARVTGPYRRKGENLGEYDADSVSPLLAGELTRAILAGTHYPRSLLANLIMRFRADGEISPLRVALCKAVLAREYRLGVKHSNKEVSMSLDITNTDPGYLLGRLFATLESVQRTALGKQVNATIRDRYYGSASATPAGIFPVLLRNAQHHLSRLRKDKPGLAVTLEKEIAEIVALLGTTFPKTLRIEAQGHFAIGYYHQTQARFGRSSTAEENATTHSEEGEPA